MITDQPRNASPGLPLLAGIALVYFLAGKLGLSFAAINASASAIWPPTGIALAAFLIYGPRVWPAIFLAAFLVNITTTGSVLSSLAIGAGNTLEGLVGAWLVARTARGAACFQQARDVFFFGAFAAGLATTISATVGTASLVLAGEADAGAAAGIWLTWWLGDAAGALVFAPPLVLWHRNRAVVDDRLGETVLALVLVMGVGALCFATPWLSAYPVAFLCLPPLAWVAYRFGPRAVSSHILLLAMMAVYTTEHGVGPFVMASRNESLLVLQSFMATLALMMLPIAALAADHARTSAALEFANVHERRARAEAEAASRAKDDFLAALTHELRNPLQAIASSLWLLDRQVSPGGEARALEIVRRQTGHITRVVSELLDMAKLAAARSTLEEKPQPATLVPRRGAAPPPSNGANGARGAQLTAGVQPRRVLIVEDNADVRLAVRTLLEHDGHIVFEADDGVTGVDSAVQLRPEVVLVDIGLPGMDGYEVARKLRARFATLRLVALTGYGQPEDRRKARGAGFDEHLVKPVDPAALQRALGERREQPATA
jgi:integral membrane sensor domain MASE1/CheY-like chemotaxis protein